MPPFRALRRRPVPAPARCPTQPTGRDRRPSRPSTRRSHPVCPGRRAGPLPSGRMPGSLPCQDDEEADRLLAADVDGFTDVPPAREQKRAAKGGD